MIVSRSMSGGSTHSSQPDGVEHEPQVHARRLRVRLDEEQVGAVGAQDAADLVDGGRDRRVAAIHGRSTGVALHLALTEARQRDRVQAAEPAAHDRHDLVGPADEMHAAVGVDAALVAQDLLVRPRARGRSAATRCRAGTAACRRSSGNAAPKRSAHIGLIATHDLAVLRVAEIHVGEREREALGDQVERGRGRRRCGCRRAGTCPCRRARSRRPGRRSSRGARRGSATASAPPTRRCRSRSARAGRTPSWSSPPRAGRRCCAGTATTARPIVIEPRPAAPPMQPAR